MFDLDRQVAASVGRADCLSSECFVHRLLLIILPCILFIVFANSCVPLCMYSCCDMSTGIYTNKYGYGPIWI